jgi:hypothetical protein
VYVCVCVCVCVFACVCSLRQRVVSCVLFDQLCPHLPPDPCVLLLLSVFLSLLFSLGDSYNDSMQDLYNCTRTLLGQTEKVLAFEPLLARHLTDGGRLSPFVLDLDSLCVCVSVCVCVCVRALVALLEHSPTHTCVHVGCVHFIYLLVR